MKKILLLTTMLIASICAMAQNLTVYYVNDGGWETVNAYAWSPEPNDNWPGSPATLTSETCKGATVYSFDVDYSKTTKIIFNDGTTQTDDLDIDPAKPYCYGGQWFATLAEIEDAGELVAYYLHGDFQTSGSWSSTALEESNGVWSISNFAVVSDPANFGVKRTTNGVQDAWYWVANGENVSAAGEYQFGDEKEMTGSNPQISAGTYTISFDPETLIMTVTPATATDLEETDAEDAVVAAFDITGKPVAADAAGIVILQYASGKAVKVFNN